MVVRVESHLIILKLGNIDTLRERFDAEAYIELSWQDDLILKKILSITREKQDLRNLVEKINTYKYDSQLEWSPQIYIENAIGDLKEEIRYKLEIVQKYAQIDGKQQLTLRKLTQNLNSLTIKVTEMRKVKGFFYERLELYEFPMDIQELSITLTSKKSLNEVELVESSCNTSQINTEEFLDQQEWDLFEMVRTSSSVINDEWRGYDRSCLSVTALIVRKPLYYIYNAYMMIFILTCLGFVPFSFDPSTPQFRNQMNGLLLLTTINFKWTVTQRLPSVPYLTSLDKYALLSIFLLVLFCVWHSLIGSSLITRLVTTKQQLDIYMLYGFLALVLLYNSAFIVWFIKMNKNIKRIRKENRRVREKNALVDVNGDSSGLLNLHHQLNSIFEFRKEMLIYSDINMVNNTLATSHNRDINNFNDEIEQKFLAETQLIQATY